MCLRARLFTASQRNEAARVGHLPQGTAAAMGALWAKLMSAFYSKKLEIVLVGLENSGKTTLLSVLSEGHPVETCPTIGLNVKLVKRGGVTMKCWDIGGQAQSVCSLRAALSCGACCWPAQRGRCARVLLSC